MKITSLSGRTDLIFAKFGGEVTNNGDYTLVQTPTNSVYHWGNYTTFDSLAKKGDYQRSHGFRNVDL